MTKHQENETTDPESLRADAAAEKPEAEPAEGESREPDGAIDELARSKEEMQSLRDQLLRKVAEFENFRRRTNDEKGELIRFANEGLIQDLLTVVDDLDRSLKAGKEHPDFDSFYKGIELVRANLMKMLERRGVKPIVTEGAKFDVDYHDALLLIPRSDVDPGSIIDEVSTGYLLHDRVIRHSKVIVASETDSPAAAEPSDA